jgi:hypothetical protein
MKVGGGNKIAGKNRSKRRIEKNKERSVEYLTVGCKVTIAFIIIFKMYRREGV